MLSIGCDLSVGVIADFRLCRALELIMLGTIFNKKEDSWAWWCRSIVTATWESKTRG